MNDLPVRGSTEDTDLKPLVYLGLMKNGRISCVVSPIYSLDLYSMHDHLYLGLDAHKETCTLAGLDPPGDVVSTRTFWTSECSLIQHVNQIRAKTKWLALEESTLSGWIAGVLRPHVDRLIVCDPVHNTFIRRGGNKDDVTDAIKICRLLRRNELKSTRMRIIAWISRFRCSSICGLARILPV